MGGGSRGQLLYRRETLQESRDEGKDQPTGTRRLPALTSTEELAVTGIQVHVTSTGV